ncbi:MAG: TetR/AcrR family transcriptional regulator [Pseudomonadota bacterium]
MSEPETKTKPRRQGPKRSETSKAAILEATREEMIENGWRGFSVDGVARRGRASKQTIYRWWPSIGAMCVDAAIALIPDAPGGVRDPVERITALILPIEAAARIGSGHYVLRTALLAAIDDEDAGEKWRSWQQDQIRAPLRMVLAELAAKHVIRRDWDIDDALETLIGPLWHRLLISRGPLKEGYSLALATRMLAAFADE